MKHEKVAQTQNVISAINCIKYMQGRPKTEMVGLSLIYGAPGLGKSRFAKRFAIQNDLIYIRLESTETAKSFAVKMHRKISEKYHLSEVVRGSTNKIFDHCIQTIHDVEDDLIIFVDEIDYAFRDRKLLGAIRDIVDKTLAVIILVGMQDAKKQLLRANAHYFDRCNYFVEFNSLSLKDVKLVCDTVADIELDEGAIKYLHQTSKGTLRKIIKLLYAIETVAQAKSLKKVQYKDIRGVE